MAKKDSELMRKIKDLKGVDTKLHAIQKAAQSKQDEYDLMLMDIEESFGCTDASLIKLGRIVTKYFGLSVTPEVFERELKYIMSYKDISDHVEDMKSRLPNAEELSELTKFLNEKADTSDTDTTNDPPKNRLNNCV